MTDRMNRNHDIPIKEHDICRNGGGKVFNDITSPSALGMSDL